MAQNSGLAEDVINDLVLNHLKGDHSCNERKGRLVFLVQRLNFKEGAEWVLLLAFVELLVETKFFLFLEDTVGKVEGLATVLSICDRAQVVAESALVLSLRVWKVGHATRITHHSMVVLIRCQVVTW